MPGEQFKPDSFEEHAYENALQNVLILDSDATTANALVPEGQFGFYPTTLKLFGTFNGTTYLIATASAV